MPNSCKYEDLRSHYIKNFNAMEILPDKVERVNGVCDKILDRKEMYDNITFLTKSTIPWWFIGVIHYREASFYKTRHLHNGDPLTSRTVHVPSGRPKNGRPPFTFEESASDALLYKKLDRENRWHLLSRSLWLLEGYNGYGYIKYHSDVLSPYIWGGTSLYRKGGYASDGKFSNTYVSKQIGCAPILKVLKERGLIKFEDTPSHIRPISNPETGEIRIEDVLANLEK